MLDGVTKYSEVEKLTSVPAVSIWCAHATNSSSPIVIMAKIIPRFPNASLFPLSRQMMREIIPNPGRIRM